MVLAAPVSGGKKKDNITRDDDRDGVVEVEIPLFQYEGTYVARWLHICCGCALTHHVTVALANSRLIGAPVLWMRWEVDNKLTHKNRIKQFGSDYWDPLGGFGAEFLREPGVRDW